MSETPKTIRLEDYRPSDYHIDKTELRFKLEPEKTTVYAKLDMRPNRNTNPDATAPLVFNGEDLRLKTLSMNRKPLSESEYNIKDKTLSIHKIELEAQGVFSVETEVEINPEANTNLTGLYISEGMFCTQCEAEGFRRITYCLDRPDVMSRFYVHMEAEKEAYPVLLSNGNNIKKGDLTGKRHFAEWEDPFPKPCYLFALVAGNLKCREDIFVTRSGKEVALRIFVEEKDLDKIDHAMWSLKQAFSWDEKVYGREYDLEVFNIVAVSHFNMGAMENKSLNIFNTSTVFANQYTATDAAHDRVRDVIAHEYFHNWSGNRVTCRDWHQLSLKEGFTVYRDASFSADHGSSIVKRIEDANALRTHQFKEDGGPTAHAVLPKEVKSFDNFYTLTIYEKGAEIIGMYRTLLGDEKFFNGTTLYFDRHDGQAVTIEEFAKAMEDAGGKDLSQFRLWYHQAGTPHVEMSGAYDETGKTFSLHVRQSCRPTPETKEKQPFLIPLRMGLLDQTGNDIPLSIGDHGVVEIAKTDQKFVFQNVPERPVPSLFRHFSAPVTYSYPYKTEELLFLMKQDSDGFNRWDACHKLAESMLLKMISGEQENPDKTLIEAFRTLFKDSSLDKAMVAEMLTLPSEAYLSQRVDEIDPDAIHQSVRKARRSVAGQLADEFLSAYRENSIQRHYDLRVESKARRALQNVCLRYLCDLEEEEPLLLARSQYYNADNMTEKLASFVALAHCRHETAGKEVIADFYEAYKDNQLLVDIWFSVQAASPLDGTLSAVQDLLLHEAFDEKSPNDIRAVVGAFAANSVHFHSIDGRGYSFVADYIIKLNRANAQIAARLVAPFAQWRKYDSHRRKLMKQQLERISALKDLSVNVYEQVSRCLAAK
jgi:aminopeptidase N